MELPTFNFVTGKREYKGKFRQLGENDILVIEGIHCLNEALTYSLPKESKFKIYISALTSLNIDEHNRIPTTDGRLIRRIVRDARTRGTSAKQTIAMWPSVQPGRGKLYFPLSGGCGRHVNSALIYELAVLKMIRGALAFRYRKRRTGVSGGQAPSEIPRLLCRHPQRQRAGQFPFERVHRRRLFQRIRRQKCRVRQRFFGTPPDRLFFCKILFFT